MPTGQAESKTRLKENVVSSIFLRVCVSYDLRVPAYFLEGSSVSLDYEELMGRAGARDPTRWRQDEDSWLGVHYRASQSSMSRVYNFEQRRF